MQTLNRGYKSLSLLLNINWDMLFTITLIGISLLAAAFVSGLALGY